MSSEKTHQQEFISAPFKSKPLRPRVGNITKELLGGIGVPRLMEVELIR
jgi:hypothetical protein